MRNERNRKVIAFGEDFLNIFASIWKVIIDSRYIIILIIESGYDT